MRTALPHHPEYPTTCFRSHYFFCKTVLYVRSDDTHSVSRNEVTPIILLVQLTREASRQYHEGTISRIVQQRFTNGIHKARYMISLQFSLEMARIYVRCNNVVRTILPCCLSCENDVASLAERTDSRDTSPCRR